MSMCFFLLMKPGLRLFFIIRIVLKKQALQELFDVAKPDSTSDRLAAFALSVNRGFLV